MPKEITFYVFLGEKRDPSEIYANSNLRNLTHITQNRLMSIRFSPTRSKKSQPNVCRVCVGGGNPGTPAYVGMIGIILCRQKNTCGYIGITSLLVKLA
jgi:hypothetical protein